MCGIAAIVGRRPVSGREGWAMLDAIRHRGPDGAGVVVFRDEEPPAVSRSEHEAVDRGDIVLAHARLSIIDLSEAGFQPMTDESGRVWVVFNGEIYNFRALRAELAARGHRFRSRTDTEVLVHGFEEWGEGLFNRIEGMFALCLHDRASGVTLLARDRLGIKPLYYATRPDGAVAVASEVKALLAAGVEPRLDPHGLDAFLNWLWVPDPDTAFAGVKKVPAGQLMRIDAGGAHEARAYWDLSYEIENAPVEAQAAELRAAVEEAVHRQMVSDVPLGAFFSGGVDSTAIAEIMRRRLAPERPACFTVGFSPRDLRHDVVPDDLRFSRAYAAQEDIDYREEVLSPGLVDALPAVIWHMDEPVADPAALSAYHICEAAAGDFTVLLSGMGADEVFGGYPRYLAADLTRRYRAMPGPLRTALKRAAGALPGAGAGRAARLGRNAQKLLREAERPFPGDYLSFLTYFDEQSRRGLYGPDLALELGSSRPGARHEAHLDRVAGEHWLHQAMYLDAKTFLPSLNLTYMDKMSMAHSIEVRVPLIDERVIDVIRRVPVHRKLHGRTGKSLFKEAMGGIVPGEILSRPKAGFGAPVRGWLAHELRPLVDEHLAPAAVRRRGLFEPRAVSGLVDDFRSGRRDTALQIWQLLTLELWQQAFLDRSAHKVPVP